MSAIGELPAMDLSPALVTACVCGATDFTQQVELGLTIHACVSCGVKHQVVRLTPEALLDFYRAGYPQHRIDYGRTMDADMATANARLNQYGEHYRGRTLDVGTANGAFVKAAAARGFEAWGQDLADTDDPSIYAGELAALYFPTEHFQTVTLHDVLEHVADPVAMLREVFRLTAAGGKLIIDFPDFFVPEGQHHWKPIEHIWLFNERQLIRCAESVGWEEIECAHAVPGRFWLVFEKPLQKRTSILVAPGIGDAYWALGKIQSFCEKNALGMPEIWISDLGDHQRSLPAVEKIPLFKAGGYRKGSTDRRTDEGNIWQEAYMDPTRSGRTVFRNHCGCDYFIAVNGKLRHGMSMEEILPEYQMDWYMPMFRSKAHQQAARSAVAHYGKYIVAYFVPHGMYRKWLDEFNQNKLLLTLRLIQKQLNCKILFIGAGWDTASLPTALAAGDPVNFVDLSGKTSYDEMLGLFDGSVGVIGYPSGATIMATVLKRPTLMFWNRYFDPKFWKNACPPDSFGKWYDIVDTKGAFPETVASQFVRLIS